MLSLSKPEIVRGELSKWKEKSIKTVVPATFVKKKFYSLGTCFLGVRKTLPTVYSPPNPPPVPAIAWPRRDSWPPACLRPRARFAGAVWTRRSPHPVGQAGLRGVLTALEGIRGRE